MSDKLGMAVVGCGWIAEQHLRAIVAEPRLTLIATVDVDEDRAKASAEEFKAPRHYVDWRDAIQDDEVGGLIICLPHHLHAPVAVAAAQSGLHVLVEKPMAISLEEADRMIAAAEKQGVVLMIGQVLRKWDVNIRVKSLISEGRIGEPRRVVRRRLVRARLDKYPDNLPWARDPAMSGGWLLYGYGAHEIDIVPWFFDTQITSVYASGAKVNPHWNDFDELTIDQRFADGLTCTTILSLNAPVPEWDCVIIGDESSMLVTDRQIVFNPEERIDLDVRSWSDYMKDQMAEFATCAIENREPDASGKNVRATMAALEAARISAAQGQIVSTAAL